MGIRIRILVWSVVVFFSILLFVFGYTYAYNILPRDILEENARYLAEIAKGAAELFEKPAIEFIFSLSLAILANNAIVNTLFALPFMGSILYTYVVILTGAVLRYYAELYIVPLRHEEILMSMLLSPHVYIEFLGYAIAVTESIRISIAIVRRSISWRNFIEYLLWLGFSYVVLFIAALVESTTIYTATALR